MNFRTHKDLLLYVYSQPEHKIDVAVFDQGDPITTGYLSLLLNQQLLEPCNFKPIAQVPGAIRMPSSYTVNAAGASLCESLLEERKRDADENENRKAQSEFQKELARKDSFRFWFRLAFDFAIACIGFIAGAMLQYHLLIVERIFDLIH